MTELYVACEQKFSCNNCKYHIYEDGEYSYCERKRCRLGSKERNWEGSWEECRYTCFVPDEQTKRYIHNSILTGKEIDGMSEEEYKIIDLKETLAIADKDNCKYYQNDNEHFEELCELLNKQEQRIQELKKDLKTVIEKYDCSVLHDSDWRSKLDDYKHNGQFCKKWGLDE